MWFKVCVVRGAKSLTNAERKTKMKTYYVALTEVSGGLHILGGGWSKASALKDAAINDDTKPVSHLVQVYRKLGRKIAEEGDDSKLAARAYTEGKKA